jgi:hypothetical protein
MSSPNLKSIMKGTLLQQTISKYSTKIVDGKRIPVEVCDGLRVFGAPIGSPDFCRAFISKILLQAKCDADKLLSSLDDVQMMVRLFSVCTVHHATHIFSSDVFNGNIQNLPNQFYL